MRQCCDETYMITNGPMAGHEAYTYRCSRCGKCYYCKHKAVFFNDASRWMWKCPDGKFREVINDGLMLAN